MLRQGKEPSSEQERGGGTRSILLPARGWPREHEHEWAAEGDGAAAVSAAAQTGGAAARSSPQQAGPGRASPQRPLPAHGFPGRGWAERGQPLGPPPGTPFGAPVVVLAGRWRRSRRGQQHTGALKPP